MNLFLDDVRIPYETGNYIYPVELRSMYRLLDWVIVRNYNQFVQIIKNNGLPNVISFDHDLGEDEAESLRSEGFSKRKAREHKKTVMSGYDCAKWLCDYCLENGLPIPEYYCHSMNPTGKENILSLLNNYKNHLNE